MQVIVDLINLINLSSAYSSLIQLLQFYHKEKRCKESAVKVAAEVKSKTHSTSALEGRLWFKRRIFAAARN